MTTSAAVAQARENARHSTGEFGPQAHAESGVIDGAMDPKIDIEAAADAIMAGCDVDYDDDFDDDRDELAKQIWDVHSVLCRDEWLPGLSIEPMVHSTLLNLYGLEVGIYDQDTDLVVQYDVQLRDLVPGIDGLSGRERAKTIAWGLATWHAEVAWSAERIGGMDGYYDPQVDLDDATRIVVADNGPNRFPDDEDDLPGQIIDAERALYRSDSTPAMEVMPVYNTDELYLEQVQVAFRPPNSQVAIGRSYELDDIMPGIRGTSGEARARIITAGLLGKHREVVDAWTASRS